MDTTTDTQQSDENSIVQALDHLEEIVQNRPELLRDNDSTAEEVKPGEEAF